MTQTVRAMSEEELSKIDGGEATGFGGLSTSRGLLPMKSMQVRASITGLSARIEIAQTFRNTLLDPMEVTYIFPLPPRAAVSSFKLEVEGRIVNGIIKERGQARRDYQQAIDSGHRAAISEEERSGVFTIRAGNIMPGETAVVHLELVGPLAIEDGEPCFRFPLVVAPRYMPGSALDGASVGEGTEVDTNLVPDASRISPPVLLRGCKSPVELSLSVDIDTGDLAMGALRSSLHALVTETRGGRTCIKLSPGERLDRDFVLRFALAGDSVGTQLSICADTSKQEDGNDGTIALTLIPPRASAPARARDIIFVLDRSGSMAGWKMVAARRAVGRMLDSLSDADRYNVYAFDSDIESLDIGNGESLLAATDRNRYRSLEWLAKVDAEGGTEMLAPLSRSLDVLAGGYQERDRMMVLITDGQVGNEDHILRAIKDKVRNVRIFSIGIDQSVNEGFLQKLAVMGGGSCALVESEDRLDEVMAQIHRRIATPAITELSLVGEGIEIDPSSIVPRRLPDLFEGSPTVIRARYRGKSVGALGLGGSDAIGMPWHVRVEARPASEPGLHKIWARGRVRDLEDRYAMGDGNLAAIEKDILGISLGFSVLSRFTSFVAIDKDHVVNPAGVLAKVVQPVEAPAGWNGMGGGPASGGPGALRSPAPQARRMQSAAMPMEMEMQVSEALEESAEGDFDDAFVDECKSEDLSIHEPAPSRAARMAPPAPSSPAQAPMAPMAKSSRSFFGKAKKRERGGDKETAPVATPIAAYQERLRVLLERALGASNERNRLQLLVQGLALMLEDMSALSIESDFVKVASESLVALRALWGKGGIEREFGEQVARLKVLCKVDSPSLATAAAAPGEPARRGFWK